MPRQLDEYPAKGWIKLSVFPYRAPILFVCKKEEMLHMCINFRMLNKQTIIDVYLIPWIDEILDCLHKARVFSKIDLSKAYHQVAVEPSHTQDCFLYEVWIIQISSPTIQIGQYTSSILTAGQYVFLRGTRVFPDGLL